MVHRDFFTGLQESGDDGHAQSRLCDSHHLDGTILDIALPEDPRGKRTCRLGFRHGPCSIHHLHDIAGSSSAALTCMRYP